MPKLPLMKPTCQDCRFYEADPSYASRGACRRHPPVVLRSGRRYEDDVEYQAFVTRFPEVQAGEWCGEFEQNQELT